MHLVEEHSQCLQAETRSRLGFAPVGRVLTATHLKRDSKAHQSGFPSLTKTGCFLAFLCMSRATHCGLYLWASAQGVTLAQPPAGLVRTSPA